MAARSPSPSWYDDQRLRLAVFLLGLDQVQQRQRERHRLAGAGARLTDQVEQKIRALIPPARIASIVDNIGLPNSGINISYGNSGTIGVFVPDFKGPFYGPLLDAIDTELRQHDRHMVAANGCGTEDTRQQALDGVRFLIERECDGIIMCSNTLRDADFAALRDDFASLV